MDWKAHEYMLVVVVRPDLEGKWLPIQRRADNGRAPTEGWRKFDPAITGSGSGGLQRNAAERPVILKIGARRSHANVMNPE